MHRDWSLIVGVEWRSGVGDGSQASGFRLHVDIGGNTH